MLDRPPRRPMPSVPSWPNSKHSTPVCVRWTRNHRRSEGNPPEVITKEAKETEAREAPAPTAERTVAVVPNHHRPHRGVPTEEVTTRHRLESTGPSDAVSISRITTEAPVVRAKDTTTTTNEGAKYEGITKTPLSYTRGSTKEYTTATVPRDHR